MGAHSAFFFFALFFLLAGTYKTETLTQDNKLSSAAFTPVYFQVH